MDHLYCSIDSIAESSSGNGRMDDGWKMPVTIMGVRLRHETKVKRRKSLSNPRNCIVEEESAEAEISIQLGPPLVSI